MMARRNHEQEQEQERELEEVAVTDCRMRPWVSGGWGHWRKLLSPMRRESKTAVVSLAVEELCGPTMAAAVAGLALVWLRQQGLIDDLPGEMVA